jgi:hypothetical protein
MSLRFDGIGVSLRQTVRRRERAAGPLPTGARIAWPVRVRGGMINRARTTPARRAAVG